MQGCNPLNEEQLTKEELEGVGLDDEIIFRGELHHVTSVRPLVLHPHWDM